jgi:hypothetical protein
VIFSREPERSRTPRPPERSHQHLGRWAFTDDLSPQVSGSVHECGASRGVRDCVGVPLGAASLDFTIGLGEHLRDRPIQLLLKLSKAFLPFACEVGASYLMLGVSRGPSAVHARTRSFVLRQKPFEVRMHTKTRIGNCKTEDTFQNAKSLSFFGAYKARANG